MADWIHCNKCYCRYQQNVKFYVTECGHIKCQKCLALMNLNQSKCLICKATTQSIALSSDMQPEVQHFFKPIPEALDKIKEVYQFQHTNYTNLLKQMYYKYAHAKKEILKSYKIIGDYKREYNRLRAILQSQEPRGYATSTPLQNNYSPHFNSTISTLPRNADVSLAITPSSSGHGSLGNRPGYAHRMGRMHIQGNSGTPSIPSSAEIVPGLRPFVIPVHRPNMRPANYSSNAFNRPASSRGPV